MITLCLALAIAQTQGAEPKSFAFESTLRTLVVFKEGFGFYIREGSALLEDGWATTNLVPQAANGTFWVYPLKSEDRVETVVTTNDNRIEFGDPSRIKSVLANKAGLKMRIVSEDGVVSEGTLRSVLDDMLLLRESAGGFKAVEYKTIKSITLTDFPVKVKLKTAAPTGRAGIGVAYVQAGVRWEPTYLMEVKDDASARLTLRGTLLNLSEELKSANLVFVIGAPNLLNVNRVDSLLQGYMTRILEDKDGATGAEGAASKSAQAPGDSAPGRSGGGFGGGLGGSFPPPIEESGELQYYTKPGFSLRPGERAMTTIFEHDVAVLPFFEWNADGPDVEYIVRVKNTTGQPFTVGPVFVVEDLRPSGQAMMSYTANGSEAELRMAKAVGVKVEARQLEVSRKDVFIVGDAKFLPVEMRGELMIENFRKRDAEIRVRRTVIGKMLEVGGGGAVKNTTANLSDPNSSNQLEWTVRVPPGQKVTLTYRYESFTAIGQ